MQRAALAVALTACGGQAEPAAPPPPEVTVSQPLAGEDLILWYVPQLKNDDTPGDEYCWVTTEIVDGQMVNQIHPCAFGVHFAPAP